jgi:hypothetical protein
MKYLKDETTLISVHQLKELFPDTSWDWNIDLPTDLQQLLGLEQVEEAPKPVVANSNVEEDGWERVNGLLKTKWKSTPLNSQQLDVLKLSIWEEIKIHRTKILDGNFLHNGHWFHCTDKDKIVFSNLKSTALERRIDGLPLNEIATHDGTPVYLKTVDNGAVTITYDQVNGIVNACTSHVKRTYECAAYHQAMLNASANPSSYNWHTGWQPQYGESV